jgi:hypothetical protein
MAQNFLLVSKKSMQKAGTKRKTRKPQHQPRSGLEKKMNSHPVYDRPELPGSNKLKIK